VYARTAYPAPKIRAFIDFLKARFGNPPYWERDTMDKARRPVDAIGE
jgi:hypothetical protein